MPATSSRQRRRTRALLLPLFAALVGCGGPEPEPEPAPTPTPEAEPDPTTSGQPDTPQPPPTANVVIKMDTFGKDVLELKEGDLIEVRLTRDRPAVRGTLSSARPRQLSLQLQGNTINTHFKPEDVVEVKLLFREDPSLTTITADAPLNEEETWLERFADRQILGQDPVKLWRERFARNVPLVVKRPCELPSLTYLRRSSGKTYFLADVQAMSLRPGDQVKLVGLSQGTEREPSGKDRALGEVYLYLVRRGQQVHPVCSLARLQTKDLDEASLAAYLENEPVTLAVAHPGSTTHLKIARVRGAVARKYSSYLEQTPDRPTIRRLRAQRDPELKNAERQVRSVYKAVDLTKESDLDKPVVVDVRVPATEGGVHLRSYVKELGLD